jgi:putative sterol carrier protein
MGRYFNVSDEFYKIYVPYFQELATNPEVGGKIKESELKIQFYITDLKAQIFLDCCNLEGPVICGKTEKEGDIKIWLKSDSAHRLWSGKVSLMPAIMAREIKVLGPVDQLKNLTGIFKPASEIYKAHLTKMGYQNLLH